MHTPYNTGKIKMGENYHPPKYVEEDSDMLTIQGWLIGDNKAARRNYIAKIAYIVLLVVAIFLAIVCK
jgi:hypothetical protein